MSCFGSVGLTAAFDTVDLRLESWVVIWGDSLEKYFCVCVGAAESSTAPVTYIVPQGSPLLISFVLSLRKQDVSFYFYANNSQIYAPLKQENAACQTVSGVH